VTADFQLLLIAQLTRRQQALEELERLLEMRNRLDVGGPLQGALTGQLPVRNRELALGAFAVVLRHELGLAGGNIRELLEENFRDSTVQFLPRVS